MGRIIVTEFISLDGVIEAPGPGEKFKHATAPNPSDIWPR
jgi:hypothetical protein